MSRIRLTEIGTCIPDMLYRAIVIRVASDCHGQKHLDFLERHQTLLPKSPPDHVFADL
jgi:hypothetical protein